MKELFERIYNEIQRTDDGRLMLFDQWYESNKDNIDSAIEKYLQEQGKVIISEDRYDDLKRVEFNNPPQYPFDY